MEAIDRLELRYEIARKAIHLSSLSIPLIYWYISRDLALFLLVPLFSGFFLNLFSCFVFPPAFGYLAECPLQLLFPSDNAYDLGGRKRRGRSGL